MPNPTPYDAQFARSCGVSLDEPKRRLAMDAATDYAVERLAFLESQAIEEHASRVYLQRQFEIMKRDRDEWIAEAYRNKRNGNAAKFWWMATAAVLLMLHVVLGYVRWGR